MGWPSERSKKEWAEEEEKYKQAQAQQLNIDEILKELLLEALNHTHSAATPQETFNMFYDSDSYREYKQAILAILAQEVNKARIDELERLHDDRFRFADEDCRPIHDRINELRKAGLV